MYQAVALLAIAWALALSGIGYAQDRGFASAIEWSPDGETIAVASSTGVWFFDTEFRELGYVEVKQGKSGLSPRSLDWNARGDLLAVAFPLVSGNDTPIQIIDVNEFRVITEIVYLLWTQVEWHPTDNLLAAGSWSGEAHVWDALTGEALFEFQENDEQIAFPWNSSLAVCWFTENVIAVVTEWETYVIDVEFNRTLQSFDIQSSTLFPLACNRHFKVFAGSHEIIDLKTSDFAPIAWHNEINDAESLFPDVKSSSIGEQDAEFSPEGSKLLIIGEGCLLHLHDGSDG